MALETIAKRLKWAREQIGRWDSPTAAAEAHGWKVSTYLGHENGSRNPTREAAKRYAKAYKVRWDWLLEGEGLPRKGATKPIVRGHVGAAAKVIPLNDDDLGDELELPPPGTHALIVQGNSMYPRYFEGEHVLYLPEQRHPEELIGRECVVQLRNGEIYVKMLRKGSTNKLFNLESWNAPPMLDQEVEWASEIKWRT